jgi:hypothetical protein
MRRPLLISFISVVIALSSGCHRSRVQSESSPLIWPAEEHCWWAALRTELTPDSVAERYARAYRTLALSDVGSSRQADTAWAQGGPTSLPRAAGTAPYAARVVAYRRGDTTLVRGFVATQPNDGSLVIPFCGDVLREAKAQTTAPRGEERDDSMPVWRRRPVR